MRRLPQQRVVAVDVDGTLVIRGALNAGLVDYLWSLKADGFRLMLWSARGAAYANDIVSGFSLDGLFDDVLSKPGYIIDDRGWSWTEVHSRRNQSRWWDGRRPVLGDRTGTYGEHGEDASASHMANARCC